MLSATTLPQLLRARVESTPDDPAYFWRNQEGTWQSQNWLSFFRDVVLLASRLRELGLKSGDTVAIMAPTSIQWELVQMAVLRAGGVVVGLDNHESSDQLECALCCCKASILVVDFYPRLQQFSKKVRDSFRFVIGIFRPEKDSRESAYFFLEDLLEGEGRLSDLTYAPPNPADPATIIFTSGTTGAPKAMVYRHEQLLFATSRILEAYPDIEPGINLACWLPMSNLFQRMVNLCAIGRGARTYFVSDPRLVMDELKEINPHIFIAVPRFFEKLYEGFEKEITGKPNWLRSSLRYIMKRAEVENTAHINYLSSLSDSVFRSLARLLLTKFRGLFGSNLRYLVSGSAPMPYWLLRRLEAMGLLVLEAYGISENVVPIAANRPSNYRFGTVGKPLPGNDIKLSHDGELLVRGPGILERYLNETSIQRDNEGFFQTGDFAEFDSDGFLTLTGRKSDLFKTSTGRKIAPSEIEGCLTQVPGIDQATVFGAGKKYLVAVASVTSPSLFQSEKRRKQNAPESFRGIKFLRKQILEKLTVLPPFKRPVGIVLTAKIFSIEEQELTANLKLRRKKIEENYGRYIETLYQELEKPGSLIHEQQMSVNKKIMLIKI